MKFINSKAKEGDFSNFNISVMVSDEFMQKVADGKLSDVWVTDNSGVEVTVKEIWDGIVEGVWRNGEPGILFYDTINNKNPTPQFGAIDTTNPCGEQPLLPFESCVLGSINLSKFVEGNAINYARLDCMVQMAIRFLDAAITKNVFPIPEIKEATNRTRKVGLGLMGVHDAMLMLRIPYDSEEGRNFCQDIMKRVNDVAVEESIRLGKEKGTFPAYEGSVWDKQGINMPVSATKEDVARAVLLAWQEGIKGMTLYRTCSREDVVLALEKKEEKKEEEAPAKPEPQVMQSLGFIRPREMSGRTFLAQSGCCRLYITVNTTLEGKPMEVFIRTVGAGCEANSNALGRSISTGLQNGVPYEKFVKLFAKVHCVSAIRNKNSEGMSCADVVGKCIELAATNQTIATLDNWSISSPAPEEKKAVNPCPECGEPLDFGEGCNMGICKHCGWSGCS